MPSSGSSISSASKPATSFAAIRRLRKRKMFYVCSLSTKVIIYKGMLTTEQLFKYYPDLASPDYTSHLAMVHSRFSTNTFPSWDRAQPMRFMSHNGEINTLRGNMNWMQARQGVAESKLFGKELTKLFPVAEPDCSDSGTFDNVLEFLLMNGRTLQESVMMMIPEAWQNHESMSEDKRAFYEYHSCLMEPWDGPASIVFTDGKYIGAVLDRNGLRPSRYYITHDDRVIMASEVGVLHIEPQNIKVKGRLQPGRMFLVDFEQGRLIPDDELKRDFASRRPYGEWLNRPANRPQRTQHRQGAARLRAENAPRTDAGVRLHDRNDAVHAAAAGARAARPGRLDGQRLGLACLSDKPRMLYDYFKQLFAQVTNPAIDSIREEVIMSLECYIGPERNLLETTEEHAHRLRIPHPILSNEQLAALKHMNHRGWRTKTIDITWPRSEGGAGLAQALDRVCAEAEAAIDEGYFDCHPVRSRDWPRSRAAQFAAGDRRRASSFGAQREANASIGIVVESGEAREVHHHCLLVGYGADAINPYLAFESLWHSRREGLLQRPEGADRTDQSGEGKEHPAIEAVSTAKLSIRSRKKIRTSSPPIARASPRACSK